YAGLLVLTPLGIISNAILVPLLPAFAKLAAPENWAELKVRIRQGLLTTAVTMLPVSALMMALAFPLSRVVYERYEFTIEDSALTASVLVAYALGMFFYLVRDVLVRVFYALEDGDTPFRISVVNIFLNALLDFFLVKPFGAPGLVLATVIVNVVSMIAMLWMLNRRLGGLPLREWSVPLAGLTIASVTSGFAAWGTLRASEHFLGREGPWLLLLQLCLSGLVGLGIFGLIAIQLRIPEVKQVSDRLRQRFLRQP
ncbi:MAG TPA: lipid II flippase MurJ, partial [Crinalium sp.]